MAGPHCSSPTTTALTRKTQLAYRMFRCRDCGRTFNERTGTPFNYLEFPTDSVLLVVMWRLRDKLSLRDLTEMFLERGFEFTHEAVRDWEARCAPMIANKLRTKRKGPAGPGMSTKPISRSPEAGVTSIGPVIVMVTWLTVG